MCRFNGVIATSECKDEVRVLRSGYKRGAEVQIYAEVAQF
jgi:hypothetical protein